MLIRTADRAVVGPEIAQLPILFENLPVHPAGVADSLITHRSLASRLGASASTFTTWPVLVGTALAVPTGSADTVKGTVIVEGTEKIARFDGVDDQMTLANGGNLTARSLTVVARVNDPAGTARGVLYIQSGSVQRTTTDTVQGSLTGGTPAQVAGKPITQQFRVVTITVDLADSSKNAMAVDGTQVLLGGAPTVFRTYIGRSASFANTDYLEVFTTDTTLTSTQMTEIYTAMKTRYGSFLL